MLIKIHGTLLLMIMESGAKKYNNNICLCILNCSGFNVKERTKAVKSVTEITPSPFQSFVLSSWIKQILAAFAVQETKKSHQNSSLDGISSYSLFSLTR